MPAFSIAFLNCNNLFPSATSRTPKGYAVAAKVADVAQVLASLAQVATQATPLPPAIIALCELQDESLGLDVASAAYPAVQYQAVWCRPTGIASSQTGLAILYDPAVIGGRFRLQRDTYLRRSKEPCRWFAGRFEVLGVPTDPVWLVVNHWPSDYNGEADGEYGRRRLSEEVGDLLRGRRSLRRKPGRSVLNRVSDRVVLLGDFNCDPNDRVFRLADTGAWRASADLTTVRTALPTHPLFYNPLWKAPDVYGTYAVRSTAPRMFDQMLFSRELCRPGPAGLRYRVGSLVVAHAGGVGSDHCAIASTLEY